MSHRLQDLEHVAQVLDQHERNRADLESQAEWAVQRDPAEVAAFAEAAQLGALAERLPAFGQARSLLDRGFTLAALDSTGRALEGFGATRDIATAAAWWAEHPASIAGAACGPAPANLFALEVGNPGGQGPAWIKAACYEPPPADYQRDPEELEVRPPGWPRDSLGYPITLLEAQPLRGPRARTVQLPLGPARQREAAQRIIRPLAPPAWLMLVWEWPTDGAWRLPKPGTHVADQVTVAHAVPAEGSVLQADDGRRWQVMNTLGRLHPLPGYLAEVLAGKRTPGPLPQPRTGAVRSEIF